MKIIYLSSIVFFLLFATQSYAQTATELMDTALAAYNTRFDANKVYIDNPVARAAFIQKQNQLVTQIKNSGFVKRNFKIFNNVMSEMFITVSLVQETNGQFAGLIVERSRYSTDREQETLRLYNLPVILGGISAFQFSRASLAFIKSQRITAVDGGTITIKYPTNFAANTFEEVGFQVLKSTTGDFAFFDLDTKWFSRMDLNIWVKLLSQNFGISSITFSQ